MACLYLVLSTLHSQMAADECVPSLCFKHLDWQLVCSQARAVSLAFMDV